MTVRYFRSLHYTAPGKQGRILFKAFFLFDLKVLDKIEDTIDLEAKL